MKIVFYIILSGLLLISCKGNEREEMIYYYNQGVEQFENGHYTDAAKALSIAEQRAETVEDDFYSGLICSTIYNVYKKTEDNQMALVYAYNAYKHFSKTDSVKYANHAYLELGVAYAVMNNTYESRDIFEKVYNAAKAGKDEGLLKKSVEHYVISLYGTQRYRQARAILREYPPQTAVGYAILAHLYAMENKQDSVDIALECASWLKTSVNDNYEITHIKSKIHALQKDYSKAYNTQNEYLEYVKSKVQHHQKQSVVTAQKRSADTEVIMQKQLAKERQEKLVVVITFSVVLLGILIAYIINIRKKRRAELYKYMSLAEDFAQKESSNSILLKEKDKQITELYRAQFKDITELATDFYSYNSNPSIIYRRVQETIDKLVKDNQTSAKLENIINLYHNNIVENLKTSVAGITENDCKLFCYYCSGFSPQLISMLTNSKIENIYKQKSRMKQKIAASSSERKEEMLQLIM